MATYTDVLRTQQLNAYFPDVLPHIAHLEGRVAELRGQLAAAEKRAVAAENDAARLRLYVAELEAQLPSSVCAAAVVCAAAKLAEMQGK